MNKVDTLFDDAIQIYSTPYHAHIQYRVQSISVKVFYISWMILGAYGNCNTAFHQPILSLNISMADQYAHSVQPQSTYMHLRKISHFIFFILSLSLLLWMYLIASSLLCIATYEQSDLVRATSARAQLCVCIMFKLNAGTIVPKLVCHRHLPCFALIFCECNIFSFNLAVSLPLDSCFADSDFLFVYLWKPVFIFWECSDKNGVHLFCWRHCWFWS